MKKNAASDSKIFWKMARQFIWHYLSDIRKASPNTVASYRDGLNAYIMYLENEGGIARSHICFEHLSEDRVKKYQDWLLNTRKLKPKTCNLRLTALRSFLAYAAGESADLTAVYVGVRGIKDSKVPENPIEFFEHRQMKAVLSAPDICKKTGRRNRMILILLYDSAARVSELLELSLGSIHLDADTPYVTLHGKGDKYRNVPLMQKTCQHLKKYITEFHADSDREAPLFYTRTHGRSHHLSADTLEGLIKTSAEKVRSEGITMPESCHCHMIRKTRAMDLYQAGVPLTHIQQLLGHEDISTTSGFYAFVTLETLAKSMKKVNNEDDTLPKQWKDPKTIQRLYSL